MDPASHYFCIAFNAAEAEDWTEPQLIAFQARCKWERRMRMALASDTIMSSFRTQYPQLLADRYLAPEGEVKTPRERPNTLKAYVAKMRVVREQGHATAGTTTARGGGMTGSERATTTTADQSRVETARRGQTAAAADERPAIQPLPKNTTKRPTPPKPHRADPNAIAIVAPTPEWEAARQGKRR